MKKQHSLLSGDSKGLSASTGRLGSLSSNSGAPEMSETSVLLGLSHSLEILSHEGIKLIGDELGPGSVSWVLLSVQEPLWDVVIGWSGEDVRDSVDLSLGDFSGSLLEVDLSNLEGKDGESSTDSADLSKTEWGLLFTVDVCVLDSQNMSEVFWVLQYQ